MRVQLLTLKRRRVRWLPRAVQRAHCFRHDSRGFLSTTRPPVGLHVTRTGVGGGGGVGTRVARGEQSRVRVG